jgi:ABC-type multidrug transport system ATPase subunit
VCVQVRAPAAATAATGDSTRCDCFHRSSTTFLLKDHLLSAAPNPADVAPVISLQNVSKFFGRTAALCDVTTSFASGRLYTLLGENGAGKSTLLRLIAGLATPTGGIVQVFGEVPRESLRRIGYMAHASMLYDEMTAVENLRYFAGLYGIEDDARIEASLAAVGLDPKMERRVGEYSQGMRQRASLARAMLHDPEVLLLDEPFSNLDTSACRDVVALLAKLKQSKTILVVTHQAALLETIHDEVLVLSQGRIATQGPAMSAFAKRSDAIGVRS